MPQPRVPTEVLKARGAYLRNPQRKQERKSEPTPTEPLGEPHKDLSKDEKAIWHELEAELLPGVAFNSDRLAFRKLVCLEAKSRRGHTTAAEEQLIKGYLTAFGKTPADRSRVSAKQQDANPDDPWSRLMAPASPKAQ